MEEEISKEIEKIDKQLAHAKIFRDLEEIKKYANEIDRLVVSLEQALKNLEAGTK